MALSSSGLGRRPLTAETRVRVPDALQLETSTIKVALHIFGCRLYFLYDKAGKNPNKAKSCSSAFQQQGYPYAQKNLKRLNRNHPFRNSLPKLHVFRLQLIWHFRFYLINNNSRYLGSVHIWSSTINSNLSI